MVVDEFLFKLGVVADLKQAKQFRQTLSDVARTASIAVTAVGALAGSITAFFAKALSGLDTLNQAARATGASAEYLQQLGFAAAQNGASLESALTSVRGLSKVIGEAADGMGRGARAFEHYGLSAKNADGSIKSVTHMIGELQNKMQHLSDPQRSAFLQKMGIDGAMLQTLRLSRTELHDLMQEAQDLGVATQEQADIASAWGDAMTRITWIFKSLRTQIALGLAPQLLKLADRFKEFLLRNKELIRDGLRRFIELLFATVRALVHTGIAIDQVIRRTIGWKTALWALVGVLAWVKRATLAAFIVNPVLWLSAAIAGLIVLIDDFVTYMQGGKSALGKFWGPFTEGLKHVKYWLVQCQAAWIDYCETIKTFANSVMRVLGPVLVYFRYTVQALFALLTGDLAKFQKALSQLAANIKALFHELFAQLGNFASKAWESILKGFSTGVARVKALFLSLFESCRHLFAQVADSIADCFETAFNRVFHAWDKLTSWLTRGLTKLQSGFSLMGEKLNLTQADGISQAVNIALSSAHPAASQVIQHHSNQANRTQQNTVNQDIKIHIASSDPVTAGRATADALRQQRIAAHNSQSAAKL